MGVPASPSRTRKPADVRRAEILAAAAAIARRDGLEGVTLRAVAEPLGVRPGLISHYFSAAEALVIEAFVLAVTAERDWLFGEDDAPLAQMTGFVRRAESAEAVELCRLWLNARHLARAIPSLAVAIDEQEALDRSRMVALIVAGIDCGDFVAEDPVGACTRIYMAVDAIGVYANNAEPFEHPAFRHFVADVAEWSLGLASRTLRAE
ncbi:TetR family transcriptional regulator [Leucobacter sp. NPDC077196]|uniref:TetR family transcriptional regulator n=1 Tax=Leucobacter sp. NPDC077196 TaxID=3154959 RepID=UPI0034471DCA